MAGMNLTLNQMNKKLVWRYWQSLNANPSDFAEILDASFAKDAFWNGPHPFNLVEGRESIAQTVWGALIGAFPDLHRRPYMFLGGKYLGETGEEEYWVSGHGDFIGTFANDFLNIPANGQSIRMRFGEFCRVKEGRIVEVYTLFDIVSLMSQAGFEVLPPGPGASLWVPGPRKGRALLHDKQPVDESETSREILENMLFKGMKYNKENAENPTMDGYWTHDMVWHGPHGIGSAFGLDEFYERAQKPIVRGYPDRIGAFHKARFGEGHCICMGGLRTLQGTHKGEIFGIPPTGRRVHWKIMDFYTRRERKLFENWVMIDVPYACIQSDVDLFARVDEMKALKAGVSA
jgi:predicted ester cyclase